MRTLVILAILLLAQAADAHERCRERRDAALERRAACESRLIRAGLDGDRAYAECARSRPAPSCTDRDRRDAKRRRR